MFLNGKVLYCFTRCYIFRISTILSSYILCYKGQNVVIKSCYSKARWRLFPLDCRDLTKLIAHYSDVITSAMASQITSLAIVYSTVYSGTDQRKHQSSALLARCEGNSPVNSPHKGPVTRKMFPFDEVIINCKFEAFVLQLSVLFTTSIRSTARWRYHENCEKPFHPKKQICY